jgi:hypothetical protein
METKGASQQKIVTSRFEVAGFPFRSQKWLGMTQKKIVTSRFEVRGNIMLANQNRVNCFWRAHNLIRLSRHISYELGRTSISQGTRSNKLLDYSLLDWNYLRYQLATADNEGLEKEGVSSLLFNRRNGTKEV